MKTIDDYMDEYNAVMLAAHGAIVEEYETTRPLSIYGYYPGGDPRLFSPDLECNTPEEVEALRAAQAAAERGEYIDEGPQCAFFNSGVARRGFGMVYGDIPHRILVRRYEDGFEEELI